MGKERLVVRNFGSITDLDIEIRPLTLFIGTQGSGKSTVAKLLTICRDQKWWLQILEKKDEMKPFVDFGINEYFQEDSFFSYVIDDGEIKYEKGSFEFRIIGFDDKEAIKEVLDFHIAESSLSYLKKEKDGLSAENLSSPHTRKVLQAYARLCLYILAERNLVGNLSDSLASIMLHQIPLSNPLLEYMSMFEKSKKEFSAYEVPFFGVKYIKKDGKDKIELTNKNKDLPLSACSSGLQSALPMLMVIDYALKTECFNSFVVEEPEQNLFPENQREVLDFLTSRLKGKEHRQFIITTHSPYLLSSLNVLMLAYKMHDHEEFREKVEEIVNPDCMVNPADVAVYSLNPNDEDGIYCKSLISEKTGMVSVNELDIASMYIGEDFDKLYRMFVKSIKSRNK
jgi:predicted ATPase